MDAETERNLLGLVVLEGGLLSEEQVEIALAEHLATGKPLGQILTDRGWLTPQQLADLLDRQADGARGIELLRTRVAEAEAELEPAPGEPEPEENGRPGHILFVWNPSGYELISRSGEPPPVGSEVGVSGGTRVVTKIGRSPLPGDRRPCAFLDAPAPA